MPVNSLYQHSFDFLHFINMPFKSFKNDSLLLDSFFSFVKFVIPLPFSSNSFLLNILNKGYSYVKLVDVLSAELDPLSFSLGFLVTTLISRKFSPGVLSKSLVKSILEPTSASNLILSFTINVPLILAFKKTETWFKYSLLVEWFI